MSSPDPSASNRRTGDVPPGEILAPSPVLTLIAFLMGVGIDWAFPVALLTWP